MLRSRVGLICLSVLSLAVWTAPAGAQPAEGSARDMFRASASRFGAKPAASTAQAPPVRQAAVIRPTPKPAPKPPKPREASEATPPVRAAQSVPAQSIPVQSNPVQSNPVQSNSSRPSGGATAILASTSQPEPASTLEPLGLRYSIVKQVGKEQREVDSDTVFRSGDRIKLQVQASEEAYLYLVLKGSSGRWKVLFPTPEIAGGDNRIPPKTTYMVPSNEKAWFSFDDQVGSEQLFILLSRQPQQDLERMIYDLRKGSRPAGTPSQEAPAAPAEKPQDGTRVMLASNQREVDDVVIAGIRQKVYSRDLVFEKVEEDEVEPEWTKAVYIVDKDASPDSRIVADVKLEHR